MSVFIQRWPPIKLKDLELIKQEENEGFYNYFASLRVKATHIVDQPSEAEQVRLFIRNLQPTCRQHLLFMPFENFIALRNLGTLPEEELARDTHAKIGSNCKGNY